MSDLPRLVELCLVHWPEASYQPLHPRLVSVRPVKSRTADPHLARVSHISDPIRPAVRGLASLTSVHLARLIKLFLEIAQDLLRRTCNTPIQRDTMSLSPTSGPARRLCPRVRIHLHPQCLHLNDP
jgi:hypothetical protein